MGEIWIAGATGRAGHGISRQLRFGDHRIVLVGRNPTRLAESAAAITEPGESPPETLCTNDISTQITDRAPDVVVNTVGPFGATAVAMARACLAAGSHYVDLANEFHPVRALLDMDPDARAAGSTVVTGAGFGVVATEALAIELCSARPPARHIRVAAMPTVDAFGPAVLASIVDAAATGGLVYRGGKLAPTRLGAHLEHTPLPDGRSIPTVAVPTGELEAARRASGATEVIAASSEVPTGRVARAVLPIAGAVMRADSLRRAALRLVDRLHLRPLATPATSSWAYACAEWDDGTRDQAWLQTGEGYEFTSRVAAAVATRLADGNAQPGAFTPAALCGPDLARQANATLTIHRHGAALR